MSGCTILRGCADMGLSLVRRVVRTSVLHSPRATWGFRLTRQKQYTSVQRLAFCGRRKFPAAQSALPWQNAAETEQSVAHTKRYRLWNLRAKKLPPRVALAARSPLPIWLVR